MLPSVDAMKDAGRADWIADARFLTAKISVQVMMPREVPEFDVAWPRHQPSDGSAEWWERGLTSDRETK